MDSTLARLSEITNLTVSRDAPLSAYTRFAIGGPADIYAETESVESFIQALAAARASGRDYMVMGGGTNLIVSDLGFRGIMLRFVARRMLAAGDRVQCDAGAVLQDLVDFAIDRGLQGLETLAGIPGSVGAAVYGNAGAYGHSISERVRQVRFFDGECVRVFDNAECEFHYRESVFKRRKDWVVFSTELRLSPADAAALRQIAARDRAVSQHYSQFDYSKARLVRVTEPREVYVSYRIRDTIFWTSKKIRLPAGEMLLTDGKITARAKCGNQVSETAKPEVSDQEPEEDILDQPVALVGPSPSLPVRPGPPGFNLPIGPPPSSGAFGFPLVSLGGAPIGGCRLKDGLLEHCHPHKKPVAPEPGTIVLIGSGLAMVMWRYHRSRVLGS